MTLPSKELINEVLCRQLKRHNPIFEKVIECAYDKEWDSLHINYLGTNGVIYGYLINLYEFAHKCKEWASRHGVNIWSWLNNVEIRDSHKCFVKSFVGDTEQEAIFKACEYIMEKTKC